MFKRIFSMLGTIKATTFLCYKTKAICEDHFCLSDRAIGRPSSMLTRCNLTISEYDACFFLIPPTKESMSSVRSYTTSTTYQTRTRSTTDSLYPTDAPPKTFTLSSLTIWDWFCLISVSTLALCACVQQSSIPHS